MDKIWKSNPNNDLKALVGKLRQAEMGQRQKRENDME